MDLGRPYAGGSFTVAGDGTVAYTMGRPEHPADVAVWSPSSSAAKRLTRLNDDLLAHKTLGQVEEIQYKSSCDGRQGPGLDR
jgi:acylaminoacyl-peptidase